MLHLSEIRDVKLQVVPPFFSPISQRLSADFSKRCNLSCRAESFASDSHCGNVTVLTTEACRMFLDCSACVTWACVCVCLHSPTYFAHCCVVSLWSRMKESRAPLSRTRTLTVWHCVKPVLKRREQSCGRCFQVLDSWVTEALWCQQLVITAKTDL